MIYEDMYEEFKNSFEEEYMDFIGSLINWSASQQSRILNNKIKEFFGDLVTQKDINEIKTLISGDLKFMVEVEE